MKKILLLTNLLLMTAIVAFSQEVVIKPTVGLNFTNFSKDPATGTYKAQLTNVQNNISAIDVGQTRTIYINLGVRIPL
jgi:hypothetical protein